MKILHVIVGLEVGGAELMLKRLTEAHINSTQYEHIVITLTTIGKVGSLLEKMGVKVYPLHMTSFMDLPRTIVSLMRLLRKEAPDIVQTWMYHADLLGGLSARFVGINKILWGIRTTNVDGGCSKSTKLIRRICAVLSYVIPYGIVCAAESSRQSHVAIGYDSKRMIVVPNGFDLSSLRADSKSVSELRAKCGFTDGHKVIGCVGRFNVDKDHANFVGAAALISEKFPNVRFLLVGRDCDEKNGALMRLIANTRFADRFVLLGERSDVPVCLAVMDIFCLSSRTEGFPNVVGEAMSMGKPCVVTDVGDASYLLGNCGVVVPKENCTLLAQGVAQVLQLSNDEQNILGQRGRDRILAEFTLGHARQRFEKIYSKMRNGEA